MRAAMDAAVALWPKGSICQAVRGVTLNVSCKNLRHARDAQHTWLRYE